MTTAIRTGLVIRARRAGQPRWRFQGTIQCSEQEVLAAFITGSEVMCKLGGGGMPGVGRNIAARGIPSDVDFGRVGAAAVASALMRLDSKQIANALGVAATTAWFDRFFRDACQALSRGQSCDGRHPGRGARRERVRCSDYLYETDSGLLKAIIQDGRVEVPQLDFESTWDILGNGFKLYASCRATHASIQLARELRRRLPAGRSRECTRKCIPTRS